MKLKETFPDFVRLNKKSTKNWGGEFKEQKEMLEGVVYWKKAYKIKGK